MPLKTWTPPVVAPAMRPDAVSTIGERLTLPRRSTRTSTSPAICFPPMNGRKAARDASRGQLVRQYLAIEVPGGVAEHREHDREAQQQGDRAEHQGGGDDHAPQRHRPRIRPHDL